MNTNTSDVNTLPRADISNAYMTGPDGNLEASTDKSTGAVGVTTTTNDSHRAENAVLGNNDSTDDGTNVNQDERNTDVAQAPETTALPRGTVVMANSNWNALVTGTTTTIAPSVVRLENQAAVVAACGNATVPTPEIAVVDARPPPTDHHNGIVHAEEEDGDAQDLLRKAWDKVRECRESNNKENHSTYATAVAGAATHPDTATQTAMTITHQLLGQQVEHVMQLGLYAYQQWDALHRHMQHVQDAYQAQAQELQRLRLADQHHRATIANLLRAVDASRANILQASRKAISESQLRAELSLAVTRRDEADRHAQEAQHKVTLMQQELRHAKIECSRAVQEKAQIERDYQAMAVLLLSKRADGPSPLSMLGSDSAGSSSLDYFKRKTSNMATQLQGMQAILAEKNRRIDEMQRQMERNMSRNRSAQLRRPLNPDDDTHNDALDGSTYSSASDMTKKRKPHSA